MADLGPFKRSVHGPTNESKINILLVDDTPANLLSLKAILEDLGQDLVEARSGEEAVALAKAQDFAAALIDVVMPGLDGFATAKLLRASERSRYTPIIFLTAHEINQAEIEEGYLLGAVDIMSKPLSPLVLRAKVRSLIELHEDKQRARRQGALLRLLVENCKDYAIFMLDAEGCVASWNPGAERIKQYKAHEIIGEHFSRFYPQEAIDRGWPAYELEVARAEGRFEDEGWRLRKDGTRFWANVVITALYDQAGRFHGFSKITRDLTDRKQSEENARRLAEEAAVQAELRRSEQRFRQLTDAMAQLVWTARPDGNIDYMNRRWTEFTGLPASVGNEGWKQILHPDDGPTANERWAASLELGVPFEMEMRLLHRQEGAYRWHLVRTVAVRDAGGNITRWFGTATDIHEQKKLQESSRYLAEASAALASIVDYESTLQKVANLAVPYFADWCTVTLAEPDGGLRRLAVAHQDPAKIALVHQLMREYPPDPNAPRGAAAVLRSGQPEMVKIITEDLLTQGAKDERHLQLIQPLGLKSYICVPMKAAGHVLGVLTFVTAESQRVYNEADLALAMDLAHRAAVAVENTQLYQALRETDRRKDEFLATLAHELRNPLAPIRNSLQILKMPRIDTELVQRSRDMMERQLQHLVRLVDDLLDVSRVMRGKIELRKERIELAVVVARAVETVQPLIDAQEHQLSVALPHESLLIEADPIRLAQVVGNLLTNAAKYTEPAGHIWLTVNRDGNSAVLRVRDNGIGIAPEMLPRIFDLFVQADHAGTKAQGGLGIGLTLVKNLVEMHGGHVEAHSAGLGEGAEFSVRLPLAVPLTASDEGGATKEEILKAPPATGFRLLVVDDNQDAANSLGTLLQLQGHGVRVVYSGVAALELAKGYRPDMVFLDIGMPGMDGYEVARQLRREPGLEHTVLTAVTGWGQQEDRRRSADAGFNHHLIKPPEPTAIERLLTELKQRNEIGGAGV